LAFPIPDAPQPPNLVRLPPLDMPERQVVPELTCCAPIKLNFIASLQPTELPLRCSMAKRRRGNEFMRDDLTARYEEILRLRAEVERLVALSKRSPSGKKMDTPKKSNGPRRR
jgi:hypothetical protein